MNDYTVQDTAKDIGFEYFPLRSTQLDAPSRFVKPLVIFLLLIAGAVGAGLFIPRVLSAPEIFTYNIYDDTYWVVCGTGQCVEVLSLPSDHLPRYAHMIPVRMSNPESFQKLMIPDAPVFISWKTWGTPLVMQRTFTSEDIPNNTVYTLIQIFKRPNGGLCNVDRVGRHLNWSCRYIKGW